MKTKEKEPEVPTEKWLVRDETDPHHIRETHPSYGLIGVSRVSGRGILFNSDTVHQHFIALRIMEARRVIDNTNELVIRDRLLCEISMTESQFAQFITQPNRGDGVPCTIHYNSGDNDKPWMNSFGCRPEPPAPEPFTIPFKREAGERAKIISDNLSDLQKAVEEFLDGSAKPNKGALNELKSKIESARRQIDANLPYVVEVASEQIEKKIASAIVEFESYTSQSLQAKGLSHLQAEAPRLSIAADKALPTTQEK